MSISRKILTQHEAKTHTSNHKYRIGIIVSRYNQDITEKLLNSTLQTLNKHPKVNQNIQLIWVPGAFELPLAAKRMATTKKWHAIICLGAIIKGETSHYDYICQETVHGIGEVSRETNLPIIFGVLTTLTRQQAIDRTKGKLNKGKEAVNTAIEMLEALSNI